MVKVFYCGWYWCTCTYAEYMEEFHDDTGRFTFEWIKEDDE